MSLFVNVGDVNPEYEAVLARMITKTVIVNTGYASDCYEWTAAMGKGGYGRVSLNGRLWQVHRLAWKILSPELLCDDMTLDHLCKHHPCWNVEHLEQVTGLVNIMRGDGACAVNSRKTQCPQGHDYTPENTYIDPRTGWRQCKICRADVRARVRAQRPLNLASASRQDISS